MASSVVLVAATHAVTLEASSGVLSGSGSASIRLCRLQAETAIEQFVPFGQRMVAAFPAADHPDEGVGRGDRLGGDMTEFSCRFRHVPAA